MDFVCRFSDFASDKEVTLADVADIPCDANYNIVYLDNVHAFKSNLTAGDTLYAYCSCQASWDAGLGHEGFVIVRGDHVVASLTTKMN